MTAYEITVKVKTIVTDNGSNFVKAFKEFHKDPEKLSETNQDVHVYPDEVNPRVPIDNVLEISAGDILDKPSFENEAQDDFSSIVLPRHIRCASHTINLLATTDLDNAIKNAPNNYYINFRQVFGKVTKLWNKLSRSTVACDIVHSKLGIRKLSFCYYVNVMVIFQRLY